MPAKRNPMRKIKETLRLKFGRNLVTSGSRPRRVRKGAVSNCVQRATQQGVRTLIEELVGA